MSGPHSVDPPADDPALQADPELQQDPFAHDDAAYVLGALSGAERAAFEQHLLSCPQCRVRVSEIRHLPRMLSQLSIADVIDGVIDGDLLDGDVLGGGGFAAGGLGAAAEEPVPDTLLPGLLRRAAERRRRRRWVVSSLAGFAAACLVALAVVLWPFGAATTRPTPRALVPVLTSPVQADVALVAKPWGTEVDLRCRYAKGFDDPLPYLLTVSDRHGREERLGTWTLPAGKEISFQAGTALRPAQISQIVIAQLDGTAILRLAN